LSNGNQIPPTPKNFHCQPCTLAKHTHKRPSPSQSRANQKFETIHSDICCPFPVPSLGGSRYFIFFICNLTRFTEIVPLKEKSDSLQPIHQEKIMEIKLD